MQYVEFKQALKDFTVFSLVDIKSLELPFHRRRLNEWQEKGYIKKILRGYYIFSDLALTEKALFEIANRIYGPSYISFETALSYYGLIPESAYGITSVSTRRTYKFRTKIAEFSYKTLMPKFFFGYKLIAHNGKYFKIAEPEKAILDYIYINSHLNNESDFEAMRVNKELFFELIDKKKLRSFLTKFEKSALRKKLRCLMGVLKNA